MTKYTDIENKEFLIKNVLKEFNTEDKNVKGILSFIKKENIETPTIYIGAGTCGLGAGADKTLAAVKSYLNKNEIKAEVIETGCIGLCSSEPLMDVQLPGKNRVSFEKVTSEKVDTILEDIFTNTINKEHAMMQFASEDNEAWEDLQFITDHFFFAPQKRIVLQNCGIVDPISIEEYVARGGYQSFIKTIGNYKGAEVCDIVEKSGLRGRGGGGFPTGRKWKFALNQEAEQKYLICNADEGDPGAFMDRAVIEGDPHRLIEGMAIAAYGIGATKAYVYIRAEYPLAIERLKIALEQARDYGILGENIFGSGFDLDLIIKMGAGAFVCGEETALIHSIEGKRGMPRPRPPFPAVSGLFGKPTIINNVESFSNVPTILEKGHEWFASIGTET